MAGSDACCNLLHSYEVEMAKSGKSKGRRPPDSVIILKKIKNILRIIYSQETADSLSRHLKNTMDVYSRDETIRRKRKRYKGHPVLSEKDSIVITYADNVYKEGEKSLVILHNFLKKYVKTIVTGVHILPFFPSSSDGGFAVINYKKVDSKFGDWSHIQKIAQDYHLAVDLVLNHISSKSKWFQKFLQGDRRYRNYFIWSDHEKNMPEVFRPRETPLFTKFETAWGVKYVWTTFSDDQIDLNYRNPEVLLKMIDVLLFYLSQGVEIIRLDAVGYLWKEPHTSCVNLSKTHQFVKLFRHILQYVAPYAMLLAEANFPYKDNISYLGEGDEAHMVYQFSLPPLVLDAFDRKDATYINKFAERTREDLLFFDFLASHDGIGMLGAKGILKDYELENLVRLTLDHGGLVSYRVKNGDKKPYELNITYFDAINDPKKPDDPLAVKRFIASQAVMLSLRGVPGIYIHSLLGSRNYYEGVKKTGINRMINREKLALDELEASLMDENSLRFQVLEQYLRLLDARKEIRSFHPRSSRRVLDLDKRLIAVERSYKNERVMALINVSDESIPLPDYKMRFNLVDRTFFDGEVEPYGLYALE
jgi:sucrose phosphorylase